MKNTIKVLGIIALVAVIGFSMTACDYASDTSTDGRLTITGLSSYNGGKIIAYAPDGSKFVVTHKNESEINQGELTVNGDSVTFYVWVFEKIQNHSDAWRNYTGNDKNVKFNVELQETNGTGVGGTVTVNFKNGKGSGAFVPNSY